VIPATAKIGIYMEGALESDAGKMGFGVLRYSTNVIACVIDSLHAGKTVAQAIGLPNEVPIAANVQEAIDLGADTLILGIAPSGGLIPEAWYPDLDAAWDGGLSLVNGLHDLLGPRMSNRSKRRPEQFIWDIRTEPAGLAPGQGLAAHLPNRRVLMIGTDMAVGKMTAGLEIYKEALAQGLNAAFVATGQIGMTITGAGVPLDAIRLDFAGGAIEREVLAAKDADLVIVEGQGALLHPSSSATLPLLRGSMPTDLILCARAGQAHLRRMAEVLIPEPEALKSYLELYQDLASVGGTFPRPRLAAVALNTYDLTDQEAELEVDRWTSALSLPVADPVRNGAQKLLKALA
jgi:uncharacterized NAD-dependent epimerase/dehydratase family protein